MELAFMRMAFESCVKKSTTTWLSLLTSKWKWQNKANAQNAMFWSILRS